LPVTEHNLAFIKR